MKIDFRKSIMSEFSENTQSAQIVNRERSFYVRLARLWLKLARGGSLSAALTFLPRSLRLLPVCGNIGLAGF